MGAFRCAASSLYTDWASSGDDVDLHWSWDAIYWWPYITGRNSADESSIGAVSMQSELPLRDAPTPFEVIPTTVVRCMTVPTADRGTE